MSADHSGLSLRLGAGAGALGLVVVGAVASQAGNVSTAFVRAALAGVVFGLLGWLAGRVLATAVEPAGPQESKGRHVDFVVDDGKG